MKTVSSNSIIDLYVWLDDNLARKVRTGRPSLLSESELLAILIQSALSENHQCLRSIYDWVGRQYPGWFVLPNYANFLAGTHRVLPLHQLLIPERLFSPNGDAITKTVSRSILIVMTVLSIIIQFTEKETLVYTRYWMNASYLNQCNQHVSCVCNWYLLFSLAFTSHYLLQEEGTNLHFFPCVCYRV